MSVEMRHLILLIIHTHLYLEQWTVTNTVFLEYTKKTYFRCYTVHVVELLNYYTNCCTYIKFIKFTH